MGDDFDANRVIRILNHPLRIRIVELLGSKGPLSWKDLSREMGTSTGTLYHHLDMLEKLVTRDSSKRYLLTKLGEDIYHYLDADSSPRNARSLNKLIKQRSLFDFLRGLFVPRSLLYSLTSTRLKSAASSICLSLVVLVLMMLSRNQVVLFSFSPSKDALQSAEGFGGSLLLLVGVIYAGMRAAKVKPDPIVLFASTALAYLPLAIFASILRGLVVLGYAGILADTYTLTLSFVFVQAWGAGILGGGMSVSSGLRIEKTLVASLALLYATAIVMLLRGVRFI